MTKTQAETQSDYYAALEKLELRMQDLIGATIAESGEPIVAVEVTLNPGLFIGASTYGTVMCRPKSSMPAEFLPGTRFLPPGMLP